MSSGSAAARLLAVADHRPERRLGNDELATTLDTSDAWIRQRTGIAARRIAAPGETVPAMAAAAAAKALAGAGVDPADVDLVILATCTMPTPLPGGAPEVAHAIGATHAGAYDVNGACAGFCYALGAAADAVRAGSARHVVVAAAERLSDWVDWTDRGSAILFGDGAGAVVVGPAPGDEPGIFPTVWGSDGALAELITIPPGGHMTLQGPAVYRWAIGALGDVARQVCAAAGVDPAELAAVVPHQANLRIIDALAQQLAGGAVVADDIVEMGNTSAASIPLALARLVERGQVPAGGLALLLGFGAGLTWAGQLVRVP